MEFEKKEMLKNITKLTKNREGLVVEVSIYNSEGIRIFWQSFKDKVKMEIFDPLRRPIYKTSTNGRGKTTITQFYYDGNKTIVSRNGVYDGYMISDERHNIIYKRRINHNPDGTDLEVWLEYDENDKKTYYKSSQGHERWYNEKPGKNMISRTLDGTEGFAIHDKNNRCIETYLMKNGKKCYAQKFTYDNENKTCKATLHDGGTIDYVIDDNNKILYMTRWRNDIYEMRFDDKGYLVYQVCYDEGKPEEKKEEWFYEYIQNA